MESTRKRWKLSHKQAKGSSENIGFKLSAQKFRSQSKSREEQRTSFAFKSTSNQQLPSKQIFKESLKDKMQDRQREVEDAYQLTESGSTQSSAKGIKDIDVLKNQLKIISSDATITEKHMIEKVTEMAQKYEQRASSDRQLSIGSLKDNTSIKNILMSDKDSIKQDEIVSDANLTPKKDELSKKVPKKFQRKSQSSNHEINKTQSPYFN